MEKVLIDVLNKDGIGEKMGFNRVLKHEIFRIGISGFDIEVIKALTVLKRSELIKRIKNIPYSTDYNKTLIIDDSALIPEAENKFIDKAIEQTDGIIVLNGEKSVDLYYTLNCGGGTANSEDVLGYRINYLRKVLCKFCSYCCDENIIKVSDLTSKFKISDIQQKEEINGLLTEVHRDETGRIINLNVMGNYMKGEEFAKLINAKSSRIYFKENSIAFKSIGEGVGLGLCLDGAENLASDGFGYEDIIRHYYTGIEFSKIDEKTILSTLKGKKILLDPGHGGIDTGNKYGEILEKNVNLAIVLELEKKLRAIEADVILTRSTDIDIPTIDRAKLINEIRPAVFISIHQNSFMHCGTNGVEAYCYEKDNEAISISRFITSSISEKLGTKDRGVKVGNYYLLRETKVSGLILECMYMSGSFDSLKYNDYNYCIIADAIYDGICKYYCINP